MHQTKQEQQSHNFFFAINTAAKREAGINDSVKKKKKRNTGLFLRVTKLQHKSRTMNVDVKNVQSAQFYASLWAAHLN